MTEESVSSGIESRAPWWRSIGPALITACESSHITNLMDLQFLWFYERFGGLVVL